MSLPHENLVAWQRADDLFIDVHRLTLQGFPEYERYEPGSQIRRAAWSVAANVVEGVARPSRGDAIRFLNIAGASLRELGYGLHAARRLGYLGADELLRFEERLRMVGGPLFGLVARYRRRGTLMRITGALMLAALMAALVS